MFVHGIIKINRLVENVQYRGSHTLQHTTIKVPLLTAQNMEIISSITAVCTMFIPFSHEGHNIQKSNCYHKENTTGTHLQRSVC
jgi:hypothetical protein